MEELRLQYHDTFEKITANFNSNMELWGDTQDKFSNLWLENFENLSLALSQTNASPKLDTVMGFDSKIKDLE